MKKKLSIIFLPLLILIITACSETGIFYSLENETVLVDSNNLNNKTVFSNMVDADNYYIGNGGTALKYRFKVDDISSWSTLATPDDSYASDDINNSMVMVGDDLYISRSSYDGSNVVSGIYRLPNAKTLTTSNVTNVTSASWQTIVEDEVEKSASNPYDYKIYKLHNAQAATLNCLFINRLTYDMANSYSTPSLSNSTLYVTDTPTTISGNDVSNNTTEITLTDYFDFIKDDEGNPILDGSDIQYIYVEVDKITSGNFEYWMIINDSTNGRIIKAANVADESTISFSLSIETDKILTDIFEYDTDTIFASNSEGSYYYSINEGSTWTESTDSKSGVKLNGFADIGTLASDNIIVGTTANTSGGTGYYQIDTTDPGVILDSGTEEGNFSEINNYNSSDLSNASIAGFCFDDTNLRLFAYTENYGVWLNFDVDDTATTLWNWSQE